MKSKCLIVLGMHRSGTSALTGVLSQLGIHPGNTLQIARENINPKGFWEHTDIVYIHEQLLDVLGASWDDESPLPDEWWRSPLVTSFRSRIVSVLRRDFDKLPIWLIKDPRICRLLPMWHEILRELDCQPLFVLSLRSPAEVALSLRKRDNLAEEASCLLWLIHMLEAEFHTRGQARVFVNYERLLADWRGTLASISQTLNLTWPVTVENAAPDIETFLDSSLHHHVSGPPLPDHPACRLALKGFKFLSTTSPNPFELDMLRTQTDELIRLVAPWSKPLRRSERQNRAIVHTERENALLKAEVARVKNTVSWQITKPLRAIWNVLRSLLPNDSVRR